jgi:hypothetical protein
VLEVVGMELSVRQRQQGTMHYLGQLLPGQPVMYLHPGGSYASNFFITLDHYAIGRLEKLRNGEDLIMSVNMMIAGELRPQVPAQPGILAPSPPKSLGRLVADTPAQFEFRIPKSDWVEKVLPQIGYADVSLLEIPRLTDPNFADVIGYVNGAWKQYELGEYDKVLTESRKALESLTKKVKEKGISREIDGKVVPDWDKLLGSEKVGEIVLGMFQKTVGFLAPSAHAGGSRSREEAEFALMLTHAFANLVIKRSSKIGDN